MRKLLNDIVERCPYAEESANKKAAAIEKALKSLEQDEDPMLERHVQACLDRLGALKVRPKRDDWKMKALGEMEGELAAANQMRELCPKLNLKMKLGFEYPGYSGIDQIWAGSNEADCSEHGEVEPGCPEPIIVVEAKATNADLDPKERKRPKGAYQMDREWIRYHADRIAHHEPTLDANLHTDKQRTEIAEADEEYRKLGRCLIQAIDFGCPTLHGLVIAGEKPHEESEYPWSDLPKRLDHASPSKIAGCGKSVDAIKYERSEK